MWNETVGQLIWFLAFDPLCFNVSRHPKFDRYGVVIGALNKCELNVTMCSVCVALTTIEQLDF